MNSLFRISLGSPEQHVWPEGYFVCDDIEEALSRYLELLSRTEFHGKQVWADLIFNDKIFSRHSFGTMPPSSICFGKFAGWDNGEECYAMKYVHRVSGELTKKNKYRRREYIEKLNTSMMWWYLRNSICEEEARRFYLANKKNR